MLILALWIAARVAILSVTPDLISSAPPAPLLALEIDSGGAAHSRATIRSAPEGPISHKTVSNATVSNRFDAGQFQQGTPTRDWSPPVVAELAAEVAARFAVHRAPDRASPAIRAEAQAAEAQVALEKHTMPAKPRRPRWSADGWALVRGGSNGPALAAGAAAYGGSQMGAVLRYNLAPASAVRPQVYVRAAAALAGTVRQPEAAFGLMLRPVRRLPLAIMGEVRVQDGGGQARARPVITAVTEIPPLRLPLGAEGEVYAQAGWAGGRDATPFYDMAAVAQRFLLAPAPGTKLRLGGGLWSGGQRGAARLDVGPRIELRGLLGPPSQRIGVRLAVDWRFRVAGEAEPGSGPAVTLAAGF